MSTCIDNIDSSWFDPTTLYYMDQAKAFAKAVVLDSIPASLFVNAISGFVLHYINPSLLVNDDLDDPEGIDFLVTHDNKQEVARRIVEQRVTFDPTISIETQNSYKEFLQNTFATTLGERIDKIDSLAKQMGIARPVQYAVSLEDSESPYEAIGDRFSFHDPVIHANISQIRVTGASATQPQLSASAAKARQEFIVAHEMSHIARGDLLARTAAAFAMGVLNIALWVHGLGGAAPLITRLITTMATSILTQAIAHVAYFALIRYQEKQADLMAMDTLGSSEGAEIFFSAYTNNPRDLEHPAISTRLDYARNWTQAE